MTTLPSARTVQAQQRRAAILALVAQHARKGRRPPTTREIMAATGITSTKVACFNINALAEQGLLRLERHGLYSRIAPPALVPGEPCPTCGRA